MPNGKRTKGEDQVKYKENGGKNKGINTRGGKIRTCIRTPGQGYYNLPNLQKFRPRNFARWCKEEGTPVTVRVSGGKKIIESGIKNLRDNLLTHDEKRYG
jgi:hypothetical protein